MERERGREGGRERSHLDLQTVVEMFQNLMEY